MTSTPATELVRTRATATMDICTHVIKVKAARTTENWSQLVKLVIIHDIGTLILLASRPANAANSPSSPREQKKQSYT